MQDSLFSIELPLVNTNEELEKIKNAYPDCDPYFIASGCIKERREKFNNLWNQFKSLADKYFLSQVKKEFHERTWEMYVGCVLKKYFSNVLSEDNGPDFVLNKGKIDEIFIEAVACKKGDSADAVPDMVVAEKPEDITVQDVPHDEMLLRLSSSLVYKAKKYKDFINTQNKPYIIAVNKGALEHLDPQIPLVLKCLFGLGYEHFKKINEQLVYNGWTRREFIEKSNGEKISMIFFEKDENDFVSAVIYSPGNILNSPDNIGSDCILIHNPKAKFPIDVKTFYFLQQWKAEYVGAGLEIKKIEP
jgi:hypothetical protein